MYEGGREAWRGDRVRRRWRSRNEVEMKVADSERFRLQSRGKKGSLGVLTFATHTRHMMIHLFADQSATQTLQSRRVFVNKSRDRGQIDPTVSGSKEKQSSCPEHACLLSSHL